MQHVLLCPLTVLLQQRTKKQNSKVLLGEVTQFYVSKCGSASSFVSTLNRNSKFLINWQLSCLTCGIVSMTRSFEIATNRLLQKENWCLLNCSLLWIFNESFGKLINSKHQFISELSLDTIVSIREKIKLKKKVNILRINIKSRLGEIILLGLNIQYYINIHCY